MGGDYYTMGETIALMRGGEGDFCSYAGDTLMGETCTYGEDYCTYWADCYTSVESEMDIYLLVSCGIF